ncbi:Hypothetical predicted protein [Olea europaea subsp. europaea]|uniref:Uncharacterized protein n=2 Tax=Olea europaea subsp. europaea TaxID=158383 RepID=A0A8S0Q8Z8_OLEEU|nr:Hypothetical predicted protein [Olea europaea subsp. europaea]
MSFGVSLTRGSGAFFFGRTDDHFGLHWISFGEFSEAFHFMYGSFCNFDGCLTVILSRTRQGFLRMDISSIPEKSRSK